jgi:hypothetical protein
MIALGCWRMAVTRAEYLGQVGDAALRPLTWLELYFFVTTTESSELE